MEKTINRWYIAIAGVVMQFMLGSVYGWSAFKKTLIGLTHWTPVQAGLPFTLVIFFLGLSAAIGGKYVDKAGARKIATIGGILFAIGTLGAGYAIQTQNLLLLCIFYGVIAGIGNGLGYLTPVAVLVRWFPDRKGLITGMAVMGFGLGAAGVGKLAPILIQEKIKDVLNPHFIGIPNTFYIFGLVFLVVLVIAAQFLNNPPTDYTVPGAAAKKAAPAVNSVSLNEALKMNQFYILWIVFCFNITAGIALVSNMANMAQDQLKITLAAAGGIVALASLFNGLGRIFWASVSDKIGRKPAFLILIATQIPAFILLPQTTSYAVFTTLACYILLCYGGGFGTMPSFNADTFGSKNMGQIYGKLLFAWAVAGAAGPFLMDYIKSQSGNFAVALNIAAGILVIGLGVLSFYKKPKTT